MCPLKIMPFARLHHMYTLIYRGVFEDSRNGVKLCIVHSLNACPIDLQNQVYAPTGPFTRVG